MLKVVEPPFSINPDWSGKIRRKISRNGLDGRLAGIFGTTDEEPVDHSGRGSKIDHTPVPTSLRRSTRSPSPSGG
jgi:hypothetical protein